MNNRINNILLKIKNKLLQKDANITVIFSLFVGGIILPILCCLYDISNMKIFKQDLDNLAQISAVSCTAHTGNSYRVDECVKDINELITKNLSSESGRSTALYTIDRPTTSTSSPSYIAVNTGQYGKGVVAVRLSGTYHPQFMKILNLGDARITSEVQKAAAAVKR